VSSHNPPELTAVRTLRKRIEADMVAATDDEEEERRRRGER
jgi:hypothetical protein